MSRTIKYINKFISESINRHPVISRCDSLKNKDDIKKCKEQTSTIFNKYKIKRCEDLQTPSQRKECREKIDKIINSFNNTPES